jgi:hypothetical protein
MRKAKSRGGRRRNFDVHPPSSIIRKRKAVIESDEEDMNHGTGDRDHTHPSKRRLLSALQQPLGDHLTGDAQPRNITLSPPPPLRRSERNRLIWSCKTEGCDYQVDTADKPDGIAKVRAHMLQHADEIAEREALILEESKPYLPTR